MKSNQLNSKFKVSIVLTVLAILTYSIYSYFTQEIEDETKRLLETNACINCNLSTGDRPNLSNKKLKNANLAGSHLNYLVFTNSDLRNANLSQTTLKQAKFFNADLSNANLSGADIRGADLSNAKLTNINWTKTKFNRYTTGVDAKTLIKAGAIQI